MTPARPQANPADVYRYLSAYGYLQPVDPRQPAVASAPPAYVTLKQLWPAIRAALDFIFGELVSDDITPEEGAALLLRQPRCSVPDVLAAGGGKGAWPHKEVRVWNGIKLPGVDPAVVDRCWRAAWGSWADVCGLKPQFVDSRDRANVWATAAFISGPGGTLAWSEVAFSGITERHQLEQRYDTGENWKALGEAYTQEVMAHEGGHALGLPHLSAGNLMQPYATGKLIKPQAGDIAEVLERYGPRVTFPDPPDVPDDPQSPDGIIIEIGDQRWRVPAMRIG